MFRFANQSSGITKKWLDALKGDPFSPDTFEYFLEAFRTILTANPSAESLRSLALFVTFATHKPKRRDISPLRATKSIHQIDGSKSRRQTLVTASPSPMKSSFGLSSELSRIQIAVKLLEIYTALLCNERDTTNIKKFARTVTNRVSYLKLTMLSSITDTQG